MADITLVKQSLVISLSDPNTGFISSIKQNINFHSAGCTFSSLLSRPGTAPQDPIARMERSISKFRHSRSPDRRDDRLEDRDRDRQYRKREKYRQSRYAFVFTAYLIQLITASVPYLF